MCGLVGFSSVDDFDIEKIKQLLLFNSFARNSKDATGVFTPKTGLIKDNESVVKFIVNKESEIISDNLFIGHVRLKTSGGNTKNNAHPFQRGKWTLVHNGTLDNHWLLLSRRDIPSGPINVDSDAILACIEKDNNFDVLSQISGAAAFIIHDSEHPNIIYVFRNNERKLFKGYINSSMYISSEEDALKFIGCINIKEFKEDHLYTIDNGSIIGEPEYIENKPIKYNHTTRNTVYNAKVANCNLRSLVTQEAGNYVDHKINLIKDQYYSIVDDTPAGVFYNVRIPNSNKIAIVPKSMFNSYDILNKHDHIITCTDIYLKKENKKVFDENTMLIITDVDERFVDVIDETDNSIITIPKILVRKATSNEISKHYEDFVTTTTNRVPFKINDEETKFRFPGLNTLVNLEPEDIDTRVEDDVNEDDNAKYTIYVTKKQLCDCLPVHFKTINQILSSIEFNLSENALADMFVMKSLKNAINMNSDIFSKIFKKVENGNN